MIHKVFPDKQKASSILEMAEDREKVISTLQKSNFPTIITENYYEIIKELATALLLLDGLKTSGENAHKEVIDNLLNYKEFNDKDVILLNDLRVKRNKSSYEGKKIENGYLEAREKFFAEIIDKMKFLINKRLGNV
jgi:cupin superfamily acireductone dioxygenase involved in methionine salvage